MRRPQTRKCPKCGFLMLLVKKKDSSWYECPYCEEIVDKSERETYYKGDETDNKRNA